MDSHRGPPLRWLQDPSCSPATNMGRFVIPLKGRGMILGRKYILLILLTLLAVSATPALGEKGDADGNGHVDLGDVILSLQVAAHIQTSPVPDKAGDVDGDGRIGLKEAIFVLQRISGVRLYVTIDFDHLPGGTPVQDGV